MTRHHLTDAYLGLDDLGGGAGLHGDLGREQKAVLVRRGGVPHVDLEVLAEKVRAEVGRLLGKAVGRAVRRALDEELAAVVHLGSVHHTAPLQFGRKVRDDKAGDLLTARVVAREELDARLEGGLIVVGLEVHLLVAVERAELVLRQKKSGERRGNMRGEVRK